MSWDTDGSRTKPVPIQIRGIRDVDRRAKEIHEMIARRAYAIYEGRGHVCGHEIEDWLQAESEVVSPVCVGCMELNGDLRIDLGSRSRSYRSSRCPSSLSA
jgi:Protein of unknown function (DUF2934)